MRTKDLILKKTTIKSYEVNEWPIILALALLLAVIILFSFLAVPHYSQQKIPTEISDLKWFLNFIVFFAVLLLIYSLFYFSIRTIFWRLAKKRLDREDYKLVNVKSFKYVHLTEDGLTHWILKQNREYDLPDLILVSYRNLYYLYCKFI